MIQENQEQPASNDKDGQAPQATKDASSRSSRCNPGCFQDPSTLTRNMPRGGQPALEAGAWRALGAPDVSGLNMSSSGHDTHTRSISPRHATVSDLCLHIPSFALPPPYSCQAFSLVAPGRHRSGPSRGWVSRRPGPLAELGGRSMTGLFWRMLRVRPMGTAVCAYYEANWEVSILGRISKSW